MIGVGAAGPVGEATAVRSDGAEPPRPQTAVGALDAAGLDPAVERPYWLALSLLPGMGPVGFGRLLERFGSAQAAWQAGPALLDSLVRVPADAAPALRSLQRRGVAAIERSLEQALHRVEGRAVTLLDDDYPPALRGVEPRPPVLYRRGDAASFSGPAVAVVGTRRATGYGRAAAAEIADELARSGVTVVSGLALGIDGEAHAAALHAGGASVAVLPSPLDRIYPPRHRELARRLAQQGGALITELPPGSPAGKPDFARRNRIIAGLSRAVVVVEAPDRSGALLTAASAVTMGRELYAVPGPIDALASRGCNRLIADQLATIVTSAAGLLAAIGLPRGEVPPSVASLSDTEALVLGSLFRRPGSLEELLGPTELNTSSLASALTLLEARGLVTAYGGATFHPTLAARRIGRTR